MRFGADEFFADAGVHIHIICEEKLMDFCSLRLFDE